MSEQANQTESGGESAESGQFVTTKDLVAYFIKALLPTLATIIVTIIICFRYIKNNNRLTPLNKVLLTILPIFISLFLQFIYYSPKPRFNYFLSILYDDNPIKTGFKHKRDKEWPFLGSAAITLNGKNYVFLGGGGKQKDALLYYDSQKGKFIDMIDKTNLSSLSPTFSAVSFDMDRDGKNDLVIGRGDGVYLYKHKGGFKFEKKKILEQKDKVPLAISISDYNKDGQPDIYISNFIPNSKYKGTVFNDPSHNRSNVLLEGQGKGWKDVTLKTRSGGISNTFTSTWVDLNQDSYPDLVLSHDSSEIEILENVQGREFKSHQLPGKGNWMGIGVGDFDQDLDQDLFLTNIGSDISRDHLSLGDVKKGQKQLFAHAFLRNDGNFKFVDIIDKDSSSEAKSGVLGEGFGWGAMFGDLDLDGKVDLLFSENFLLDPRDWLFPGASYHYKNKGDGKFDRVFQYRNPNFGQTPLLVDFNKDQKKDLVWVNQQGDSIAYLNNSKNNYLNVKLPENVHFVNAKIHLHTNKGVQYREVVQGGEGFGSNSSNVVQFGLGKDPNLKLKRVEVFTLKGEEYVVENPRMNSVLTLKELKKS